MTTKMTSQQRMRFRVRPVVLGGILQKLGESNGLQMLFDILGLFSCCPRHFLLIRTMFSIHLSITITLLIFDVANFSALSFCDSVKYFYSRCHSTSMFFVATRDVVLVVRTTRRILGVRHTQSSTHTPHGFLFGVMGDHGVKTCIHVLLLRATYDTLLYVVLSNMLDL